ncbi:carbohydrate ABC transporter substrate-binding protein (CUT1 family) [Kineothrix alysoides]|uniref:Carbohydrate ABC transporter substrate-binding protein (CUT1 family) n=1 Tax=Kineothrix alysoides TaxID=1469948 RepID=A0A4R1QXF0_9FIRM|nr:ABC transporter substrate-binding protein [Kineothrix alysoides]TCL58045.1 carbohydrate ABC transporter substrate-binding protein (CUT1 family) [Kineothrix alysoides]
MKKKLLSLVLCIAMSATMLAGCGSTGSTETATESTETTETAEAPAAEETTEAPAEAATLDTSTPVTLKWYLHGSTVNDDKAVMAKVNEYLGEKLNVTLEPIWGTWGDFDEGSTLAINGGDDVDIYFTCSWSADEYNSFAKKGAWVRLDDPETNLLANYGSDIWNITPEVLKTGAEIEGSDGYGVYALPGFKDFGTQNTWDINVTLLEKYGYTLDDIRNTDYYGFGDILKTVKEGEGADFYPLLVEGAVLERMVDNSIIVNGDAGSLNVLSYYIDPTDVSKDLGSKIVNKFATEEYKKFVEQTREYYLAGYIDPGCANKQTANDLRTATQLDGKYLIGTQSYALGYEVQASAERGIDVAFVPCTPPYVDKTSTQGAMMAISTASKNPERAMAFLNLLNTDPYLMTLLEYGVEGTHYNLNDDGLVVFTKEHDNYQPWRNGMGNVTLLPPQEGEGKDFFTKVFIPYYEGAKAIPAFGYQFDPTSVETELATLANVGEQYALALSVGSVDPATALPEFLDKLEAAGMSKVVDEANVQLDAYFANEQ